MTERKIPLRKCVGCGEMKEKRDLIRVVKPADGDISVDLTGKLAGRGAYICRSKKCFDAAFKAKRLEKALKCRVPEELYASLLADVVSEDNL